MAATTLPHELNDSAEITREMHRATEKRLNICVHKELDRIERMLWTNELTLENRKRLERELEEYKKVLKVNEKRLYGPEHQNTKIFMTAASLVSAGFLVYGLYWTIYNVR